MGRDFMNAVGIDVSKGKSMVAAMRPLGEVALAPREFCHTEVELEKLIDLLLALGGETRVVMEATGRYHEPVVATLHDAGIYVSVVNPILVHDYGNNSVRRVKTDKKDALKIARYTLDNWDRLREYTPTDAVRQQAKLFSRQYDLYMKTNVSLQNNLISLLDKAFPGATKLFSSPARADGHQKWIDFVSVFWHCQCVCHMSEAAFTERYRKWCKRNHYHFSAQKASDVYISSCGHIITLPKNANTKLLITSAVAQLTAVSVSLATVKAELLRLAALLPEHGLVSSMYGVGDITGAQLMAEIGDVRRFTHRGALIAFAGVDPSTNQSGTYRAKSGPSSKRGSPHLRKTLFQIISAYLRRSPDDQPVYQFLDRKRSEGKPFFVYMTATANKFLRIYYACVKEYLGALEEISQAK
jgi:transposase